MGSFPRPVRLNGQRPLAASAGFQALTPANKSLVDILKVEFGAGNLQLELINEVLEPWVQIVLPEPPYRPWSRQRRPPQPDAVVEDVQPLVSSTGDAEMQVSSTSDAEMQVSSTSDAEMQVSSTSDAEMQDSLDGQMEILHDGEGSVSTTNERYYTPRPLDYRTPSPPSTVSDLTEVPGPDHDGTEPDAPPLQSDTNLEAQDQEVSGNPDYLAALNTMGSDQESLESPAAAAASPIKKAAAASPINAFLITIIQDAVKMAAQKANEAGDPLFAQCLNALLKRSILNPRLLNLLWAVCRGRMTETRAKHIKILLKYEAAQIEYQSNVPRWYSNLALANQQRVALSEEPLETIRFTQSEFDDAKERWDALLLTQWRAQRHFEPLTPEKTAEITATTKTAVESLYRAGRRTRSRAMKLLSEEATHVPSVMILLDEPGRAQHEIREKVFQVLLRYAKQEVKHPGSHQRWFQKSAQRDHEEYDEALDSSTDCSPP